MTGNGRLTRLVTFHTSDGTYPWAGLVQGRDGNFYGTTYQGGANGYGTVFQMTPDGALTTLISFDNSNGANPYAGLAQGNDGNFYGTTYQGTASTYYGSVFRVTTNGALTTLVS